MQRRDRLIRGEVGQEDAPRLTLSRGEQGREEWCLIPKCGDEGREVLHLPPCFTRRRGNGRRDGSSLNPSFTSERGEDVKGASSLASRYVS